MRIFLPLLSVLFVGCGSLDTSKLHDERFTAGCAVVTGNYTGTFATGSASACKLVCSESLPENYKYSYNSGGCQVSIGD